MLGFLHYHTKTPASRTSRLKRRLGTQQPRTQLFTSEVLDEILEEPPLKKFKHLFETSDPDKIAQSGMEEYKNMFRSEQQSLTQAETQSGFGFGGEGGGPGGSTAVRMLDVVPEEEEESGISVADPSIQTQTQGGTQRSKKRTRDDEDVEMRDGGQEEKRGGDSRDKRRAVEGANSVRASSTQPPTSSTKPQTKPPSSSRSNLKPSSTSSKARPVSTLEPGNSAETETNTTGGAKPGKPDKDAAFLKAVASTKRGKKHEDEFDREFNNLRISRPDLAKEDEEIRRRRDYTVLDEFGYDGDIRGNFMVVVQMEVPERKSGRVLRRGDGEGVRMEWVGKPDFKKFKKVCLFLKIPLLETLFGLYALVSRKPSGRGRSPLIYMSKMTADILVSSSPIHTRVCIVLNREFHIELWSGAPSQPYLADFSLTPAEAKTKKPKPSSSLLPSSKTQRRTQPIVMDDDDMSPPVMTKRGTTPATPSQSGGTGSSSRTKLKAPSTKEPSSRLGATSSTTAKPESSSNSSRTAKPTVPSKPTRTRKTQPLFIENDDEDEEEEENLAKQLAAVSEGDEDAYMDSDNNGGGTETLKTNGKRTQRTLRSQESRQAPKATTTGRMRGGTTARKPAAVMDDDSDGGVTFKGFGAKKTRGRRI